MKLSFLLSAAILPLGLMASPEPEADVGVSPNELDPRAIHRPQQCQVIGGATQVNCRRGPRTKYSVRTKLRKGTVVPFWCVVSGECITIGGSTNCGWHYSRQHDCYVNGHYTDNHCTLARLGKCGDDDRVSAPPFR